MIRATSYEMVLLAIQNRVNIEGSQKKAAESFGISPQYLSDIMRGNRDVPDLVLGKIGVRKKVVYEWIEHPEEVQP